MSAFFVDLQLAPCAKLDRFTVGGGWAETLWNGRLYRESFGPGCWITPAERVPFRLWHDGPTVGHLTVVTSHGKWHVASAVIDDGPLLSVAREQIKPGARVSIGARSISRDDDPDLRIVRHRICTLDEVALVRKGEVPGFLDAKVTHVYEPKPDPPKAKPAVAAVRASSPSYGHGRGAMILRRGGEEWIVEPSAANDGFIAGLLGSGYVKAR